MYSVQQCVIAISHQHSFSSERGFILDTPVYYVRKFPLSWTWLPLYPYFELSWLRNIGHRK
jgi:hypothetical protein